MKKPAFLFLVVSLAVLAIGCGNAGNGNKLSFTITGLGWYYENIDTSFWTTTPPNGQTAFYDFFVHYNGTISYNNIVSAKVTAPDGRWWNVAPDSSFFDASHRVIGGFGRWWDGAASLDVLPIGSFQVEVKLSDDSVSRFTSLIPAPGALTTSGYNWMYSSDDVGAPVGGVPMVKRAGNLVAAISRTGTQQVNIQFTVNDSKVYNGFVWFYDSANNYLGGYFYFCNPATGTANSQLSGALNSAGGTNTLTLAPSDITLGSGVTSAQFFANAGNCIVVLTDGKQYGPRSSGTLVYDGQSVSARAMFP